MNPFLTDVPEPSTFHREQVLLLGKLTFNALLLRNSKVDLGGVLFLITTSAPMRGRKKSFTRDLPLVKFIECVVRCEALRQEAVPAAGVNFKCVERGLTLPFMFCTSFACSAPFPPFRQASL